MTRPPHSADELMCYIENLNLGLDITKTIQYNIRFALDVEYGRGAESVVERVHKTPRKEINYHCPKCHYHGRIKLRRLQ